MITLGRVAMHCYDRMVEVPDAGAWAAGGVGRSDVDQFTNAETRNCSASYDNSELL